MYDYLIGVAKVDPIKSLFLKQVMKPDNFLAYVPSLYKNVSLKYLWIVSVIIPTHYRILKNIYTLTESSLPKSAYTFSPERKTTEEKMAQYSQVRNSMDQEISSSTTMKAANGKITLSSPEQKLSDRKKALPLPKQKSLYMTFLFQLPQKITHPSPKNKLFDSENTSSSPDQNASDEKTTPSLQQESSDSPSLPEQNLSDKKNGSSSPKQKFPDEKLSLSTHSNGWIYRNVTPYIKV